MTRESDLSELAALLSTALEKARQLNLPTSAYILSMAMLEVSQVAKAGAENKDKADDKKEDDVAR
jgi:hypothetical protein